MSNAKAELDKLLDSLAPTVRPLVQHIEAKLPVTKDHYGDYMTAIAVLREQSGDSKSNTIAMAIGAAMIRVGANKQGVHSALRVLGCM